MTSHYISVTTQVPRLILASALLIAGLPTPTRAESSATFPDGAKCLFAGHSFFIPAATRFNELAAANGYPGHEVALVFSSGASGSPQLLWDDETDKAKIVDELDNGDVELFGLTTAFGVGSSFESYAQWIDLALSYNPDTEFLIGVPWVIGGPNFAGATEFAAANETGAQEQYNTVSQLREAYPEVTIHFIAYGPTASMMYDLYEQGQLPDILGLTPNPGGGVPPASALFADGLMGHGGPMMVELSALAWMERLYGAEVENLIYNSYQADVESIVNEVSLYNEQFAPAGQVPFLDPIYDVLFLDDSIPTEPALEVGCAHDNIIYAVADTVRGPKNLELDLYMPAESVDGPARPSSLPGMIVIHGAGTPKESFNHVRYAVEFAKRGYVTVSIDYRSIRDVDVAEPTDAFIAFADDAAQAFAWMVAQSGPGGLTEGLDVERIGMGGGSLGAMTALHQGFRNQVEDKPRAIYSLWGNFVGLEDVVIDAADPPVFIVHGTDDRNVPYSSMQPGIAKLDEFDVPYELVVMAGMGHSIYDTTLTITYAGKSLVQHMMDFFYDHLGLGPAPGSSLDSLTPNQVQMENFATEMVFHWKGESGKNYDFRENTDLSGPVDTWPYLANPHPNLNPINPELTNLPAGGNGTMVLPLAWDLYANEPRSFFAVTETAAL